MNKLEIRCFTENMLDNDYRIVIFNNKHELILNDVTKYGKLFFNIPYYGIYKILVIPLSKYNYNYIYKPVFIHKNFNTFLPFCFYKNSNPKHKITFILTDKNYKGLPIKKGEINLWKNHM